MTAYALRLQNSQDTAARVRIGDLLGLTPAGALTARTGIRPAPTAGDVAAVAGTMNVTVQPFVAWVQGGVSTAQGGYVFVLDAQATLALANGHATLSRTDVVAAVVKDDAYDGSGLFTAEVTVVQGTPGGGTPALPTNALPIRNITVPANLSVGTGGLTAGNLSTDRRTYVSGLGGVVTVASQAERDALPATNGTVVYRKDTDALQVLKAGTWETLSVDTNTDAAVTYAGGVSDVFEGCRVYRRGSMGVLRLAVSIPGGAAAGATLVTTPTGYRPPAITRVMGWNQAAGSTVVPLSLNTNGVLWAEVAVAAGANLLASVPFVL